MSKLLGMPSSFTFEALAVEKYPLVNRFYKDSRYTSKCGRQDRVWVARQQDSGTIVAALRLCPQADGWLLRAMVVAPAWRRHGIGAKLLHAAATDYRQRNCYCYPFCHLQHYYQAGGFVLLESDQAPVAIAQAYDRYRRQGRDVLLMWCPVSDVDGV